MKPLFMLSMSIVSLAACAQSSQKMPYFEVTEQSLAEARLNYPVIIFDGPASAYETLRREVIADRSQPSPAHCITTPPLWEAKRPPARNLWNCFLLRPHPSRYELRSKSVCNGVCPSREFWKPV